MEKSNIYLKYYIKFIENKNEILRHEISNIRNQYNKCDTCVSVKKEVIYFYEMLSKFTKRK